MGVGAGLLAVLLLPLLLWGLHALIRRGLRAPRLVERSDPGALGLDFETLRIPTANGKTLGAWWVPAPGRAGAPVLVVLHGWGGNAEMMLPLAPPLHGAGYALLFLDARNHGMSDGDSFSSMPRFAEDLEHALDWLQSRPDLAGRPVGLVGHSVGAAAAILAASRRPGVGALVSLSSFSHPRAMMLRWLAEKGIPFRPLGWYILGYVERTIGHAFDAIAPSRTIRRVGCPVLLIHGRQDTTVPVREAMEIHAARSHEGVRLMLLEGGHDEFAAVAAHMPALLGFLDEALGLRAGPGGRSG